MTTTSFHMDATATTVVEILSGVLETTPDALVEEPLLGAYDWDSVAILEALVALEGAFGVEIDLQALHHQLTAGDLIELVRATLTEHLGAS
ncbi:acyl carrier protein [Nonomuraea soli]|uniref:Acyl carrier protein n=1 Tax=Nonomuraea soli TaxID=1032476 RepID=A0A7W0CFX0_9ACTN|nr:acyl carrier protein [Nonomuraea soli]MBA2890249.1 acyl carrier protein [Nonomuraea soli]